MIQKMLHTTIEIEGLLRVISARKDAEAEALLREKLVTLNNLALSLPHPAAHDAVPVPAAIPTADETHAADEAGVPADEIPVLGSAAFEAPAAPEPAEPAPESATQPEPEPEPEPAPEPECMPVEPVVQLPSEQEENLVLNDLARKRMSGDLSKAFSINDKFRFIREIFDGDASAFNDAIAAISARESLDQAYDYLLNELQLDAENEAVGEFISIVANHFNAV